MKRMLSLLFGIWLVTASTAAGQNLGNIPSDRVLGRDEPTSGQVEALTPAETRDLLDLIKLEEDTTYVILPTGHDTLCNGSASVAYSAPVAPNCAFATPQGALDWVTGHVDANGYFIKFRLNSPGGATYGVQNNRRHTDEFSVDPSVLMIDEVIKNMAGVEFEGPIDGGGSGTDFTNNPVKWDAAGGLCVGIFANGGIWRFQGIDFINSGASDTCIFTNSLAIITFNSVNFGGPFDTYHIHGGGQIKFFGDYSISADAHFHMFVEGGGVVDHEGSTVELIGTPNFNGAFVLLNGGADYIALSVNYVGSATGTKFISYSSSLSTDTPPNDLFPGSIDGRFALDTNQEIFLNNVGANYFVGPAATTTPEDEFIFGGSDRTPTFQIIGAGSLGIIEYGNASGGGSIDCGHSRSGSPGTYTIVQDDDILCRLYAYAADGVDLAIGAGITFRVDGTPEEDNVPGEIVFQTAADAPGEGATAVSDRLRVAPAGHFQPMDNAAYDLGADDSLRFRDAYFDGTQLQLDDRTDLRFVETEANGDNYSAFEAPASLDGNTTCTLQSDGRIPDSCVGNGSDDGGAGSVGTTGTPADNQVAVFTDASTLEGTAGLTYDGSTLAVTGIIDGSTDIDAGDDVIVGDDIQLSAGALIDMGGGDVVITFTANDLAFSGVTGDYSFDDTVGVTGSVTASVDVTATAGDVTSGDDIIAGDDVLVSASGVLNFDAGDCTLTDGTNMLTMDGCDLTSEVIIPDGDNTRDFGSAAATWATAHINSIELANGTANTLTASGGVLSIEGTAIVNTTRTLTGGTGIAAIGDLSADRTITWDPTETNSNTFGSGTYTTLTFDAGATDPNLTFGSGTMRVEGITSFRQADAANAGADVRWLEDPGTGSNYIAFVAPASITSDVTCTFENDSNPIPDSCVGDGTDASGADQLGSDADRGDITISGGSGTVADVDPVLTIDSTADAVDGIVWTFEHSDPTPDAGDDPFDIVINAGDDQEKIAGLQVELVDDATTTEDAYWLFTADVAGTDTDIIRIGPSLLPAGDNTIDLGSGALTWATAHINSIELANGTANTLTATGGVLSIEGTALVLTTRTLTGGSGIAAIGDLSADRTITWDPTETNSNTFGSGTYTTLTFDAGATDPVWTYGSDTVALTAAATVKFGSTTSVAQDDIGSTALTPRVQVSGTDTAGSSLGLTRFADDAVGASFQCGHADGASVGTFTAVDADDDLCAIVATGADGTNNEPAAAILFEVDTATGANDMPGRIGFLTTPDASATPSLRMTIKNDGGVIVGSGTTSPGNDGDVRLYSADDSATGPVLQMHHDDPSADAADIAARWEVFGGADDEEIASITMTINDPATTTEDTQWDFIVRTAGSDTTPLTLVADDASVADDLLLPSAGAVLNFNGGDCTLTDGANILTIAGGCTLTSEVIVPDGDNTRDLGSAAATWATFHATTWEAGNATDTTVARSGAGDLSIEGNGIYRAGGTDVAVADGGTGASSLNNLITLGTHTTGSYVADLTAGTYIDVSGGGSETATITVDVDATEMEAVTFGAGGNASNVWTFNLSGTDPTLTWGSANALFEAVGSFRRADAANAGGQIQLLEDPGTGSNFIAFVAPASITTDQTCTLENDSSPIPDSCVGDGTDASGSTPADADYGDITLSGSGTVWDVDPVITIDSTADAVAGVVWTFEHSDPTPDAGDDPFEIVVNAGDDQEDVGRIRLELVDDATTTEDTYWSFTNDIAGANTEVARLGSGGDIFSVDTSVKRTETNGTVLLTIQNDGVGGSELARLNFNTTSVNMAFYANQGAGSANFGTTTNHALTFITNGSTVWTIDNGAERAFLPLSDDSYDIGSASLGVNQLFLGASGSIEFNGDTGTTLTDNGAGELTLEGDAVKHAGKQMMWVPASAMQNGGTSPASCGDVYDSGSNDRMFKVCAFDTGATEETAEFSFAMPKAWNESTITYQAVWTNTGGSAAQTVQWEVGCLASSDDDALNTAVGTTVTVSDTFTATNDLTVTAESSAITIAGTPAENDIVNCKINRDTSVDNLGGDALLIGVKIFWTDNASTLAE